MKTLATTAALFLAALGIQTPVLAQQSGYVTDSRGAPVKNSNGLCWRTGYWTPGMATRECDPELAPAPAPKPMAVAAPTAPAQPRTETLSLSSDGLFQFNKAVLLPAGKKKLDELVAKLAGKSYEQIQVAGYTDRLGSQKINQRLSQKRAEAVKAYLVAKKLDGKRIVAEGKGSADPVTKADQCVGKPSPKVIACLAADRRVEILVRGLK